MSENSSIIIQPQQLRYEYEQLQQKYQKALQELMHVLQVNKTLQQSHQNAGTRGPFGSFQQEILLQRAEAEQAKFKHKQSQQKIGNLERTIKHLSQQKQRISQQLSAKQVKLKQTETQLQQVKDSEQSLISAKYALERQFADIKRENLQLLTDFHRGAVHQEELQHLRQETSRLQREALQLQNQLRNTESLLDAERIKLRAEVSEIENYYLSLRKEQSQKLKAIESTCIRLESELHNSKSIEQLLQDQSRHMHDEQALFQSFREQIHKINENWNKFDQQKQEELQALRAQHLTKSQQLAEFQVRLENDKQEIKQLKTTLKRLESDLKDKVQLEQRISQFEREKSQLLQKNYVLEALTMTQAYRPGAQASERIHQFERRIKMLLEEKAKGSGEMAGIQQVVILKSYIRELSELLNSYKRREQKLHKSKSVLKMRQKSLEKDYQGQLSICKKKIRDYDSLVAKFYRMLEQKLNQKPDASDQEIRSVISQYEEKMIRMSEQIIQLKNQIAELSAATQEKEDSVNNVSHALQEDERHIQQLKQLLNQQQFHISGLEAQNRNLIQESTEMHRTLQQSQNEARDIFRSKDQIISGLTEQNSKLESALRQIKKEKEKIKEVIDSYEKEVNELRAQVEKRARFKPKYQPNVTDSADLLARINELNQSVTKLQKDKEELSAQSTQLLKDNVKQYELKFEAQNFQLEAYKAQLQVLHQQIEKERSKREEAALKDSNLCEQKYKWQIEDLRAKNNQQQLAIEDLNRQIQAIEDHYKQQVQALQKLNHDIATQLTHKQAEIQQYQEELQRLEARQQENLMRSTKEIMTEFEDISTQALRKNSRQIDRLNSDILSLKTAKLALENEIKDKDYLISELKHEVYTTSLKLQKQRSSDNLYPQQSEIQRLKAIIANAQEEINALRIQNQELKNKYAQSLGEHKASLIKIEEKQDQINKAIMNNTSLEGVVNFMKISTQSAEQAGRHQDQNDKIDLRPKVGTFTPEKYKVVESYDTIPVTQIPKLKPAPRSAQPSAMQLHETNFQKKRPFENVASSKRSIKMIKMAARPSIELDSPLLPPQKRKV